jgi:hypothetical protein
MLDFTPDEQYEGEKGIEYFCGGGCKIEISSERAIIGP